MMLDERERAALYRIESGMNLLEFDTVILAKAYRNLETERDALKKELKEVSKPEGYYCVECGNRLNYDNLKNYYCNICEGK